MGKGKKEMDKSCRILLLPDCVLRVLFTYLDTTSLYFLARTCRYFKYFIEDPTFWKYIDARADPNSDEKVHYCCDRIHGKTSHVLFKAKDKTCGQVPTNFFQTINPFKNLRVLALEKQRFSGSKLLLKDFPTCLEELSLRRTHIKSADYFFQHSDKSMQRLKVLILDGCKWVTCSFLMSVAKYENLEIISAVKCLRLHLNMVPYLNVARLGCKKLKVFDCRFTGIGHELLRSFYPKESIQSLYFQSLKSAELDYNETVFNNNYMYSLPNPTETNANDGNICDESLFEYMNSIASEMVHPMPRSLLYQDPYPNCTCGNSGQSFPESKITEDYIIYEPPRRQLMKFVCQKHFLDVQKLPKEFKEFFNANQKQFFTDMNSDVDSDPDSSDSDSDNACCMYGMGRRMVLLTPGNNHDSVQEEVIELNRDDRRERCNVSIFIASPLGERANSNGDEESESNSNPMPSTSRSVSENSINENMENLRNEAKRRHSDKDSDGASETKRAKVSHEDDRVSDEVQEAQAKELVESATDMRDRLNEFLQNSMDKLDKPARFSKESQPSTSRSQDPPDGTSSGSEVHNNVSRIESLKQSDSDRSADLRSGSSRFPQQFRRFVHLVERNQPRWLPALPNRANMEGNRFVNPFFIQVQNKHSKKKLSLHRLSLRGFVRVTDFALEYIKNLKIDLIDLTYTNVTREGIESFLVHNPNCRVIHPLYCVCKPNSPF